MKKVENNKCLFAFKLAEKTEVNTEQKDMQWQAEGGVTARFCTPARFGVQRNDRYGDDDGSYC